jgi:hypothetical protein
MRGNGIEEEVEMFATNITNKIKCMSTNSTNFNFSIFSRPAVGPTQPPFEWVPGALSPGVKRHGREADHSPPDTA